MIGDEPIASAGTIVVPPAPIVTVRDGRLGSCVTTGARSPATGSTRNAHASDSGIVLVATKISCVCALPGFAKLAAKGGIFTICYSRRSRSIGPAVLISCGERLTGG